MNISSDDILRAGTPVSSQEEIKDGSLYDPRTLLDVLISGYPFNAISLTGSRERNPFAIEPYEVYPASESPFKNNSSGLYLKLVPNSLAFNGQSYQSEVIGFGLHILRSWVIQQYVGGGDISSIYFFGCSPVWFADYIKHRFYPKDCGAEIINANSIDCNPIHKEIILRQVEDGYYRSAKKNKTKIVPYVFLFSANDLLDE